MFKFLRSRISTLLDRDVACETATRIEERFDKLARLELDGEQSLQETIATGPLRLAGSRDRCRMATRDIRDAGHKTALLFGLDFEAEAVTVSHKQWEPAQGQFKLAMALDICQKPGLKAAKGLSDD